MTATHETIPGTHTVRTALEHGVLTVTIDRPARKNAIDPPTWQTLGETFDAAAHDPDVRVVVLTGAGEDFCSGADIATADRSRHPVRRMRRINDVALLLHRMPQPTVARVRGVAVGAGWNLALGCDLVVAERGARFSQIFARRGLSVDVGGTWLLPRIVGLQQAKRLALLADMVSAEEALSLGLVTIMAEPGELDQRVAEVTARLAAGPPVALSMTKALLEESSGRSMTEALEAEARAQAVNLAGTDARAARDAFVERRDPTFTGDWNVG